jgi:2-polyprenyl-3-methyl-5-hydroxy-6-metoxy-1,4-benzoquinol methylase
LTWAIEWRHWLWEPAMRKTLSAVDDWNGLNVCELGPRSGRLAVYLAGLGARVTGYELDGVDLSDARRTASESGVDELVSFRNYDGDTSSIGETFDVVVTKSVLAAMPAATAVASIRTLVRPGG